MALAGVALRRAGLFSCLLLAWAPPARGEPIGRGAGAGAGTDEPSPAAGERWNERAIEILVVGSEASLQSIRSLLGPRNLGGAVPRWARLDRFTPLDALLGERPQPGPVLRCWLDLSDARRARLYFGSRSGEHFLVRDVELSGRFDEVDRESIGQVLELSINALLEDERIGLTRAETRRLLESRSPAASAADAARAASPSPPLPALVESPAAPPPPASRRLGFHPSAALFYAAQMVAAGTPVVHGPGLLLSSDASFDADGAGRRWAVWVSGQYQLPESQRGAAAGLRFDTTALRAGIGVNQPAGGARDPRGNPRSHLRARVGAGVDLMHLTPQPGTVDPSAALTPARWTRSLALTAAVGAGTRIGSLLSLSATLFVDVLPIAVEYDVRVDGNVTPAFAPWRIRPGLALDLALH
jgi:hypothetical protein